MEESIVPVQQSPVQPTQPVSAPVQSASGKKSLVLMILIHLIAITIIGYFVYQNIQLKEQISQPQQTPIVSIAPTILPTTDPTANWKIYKNEKYGFEFKYPVGWSTCVSDYVFSLKPGNEIECETEGWDNAINIWYWLDKENKTKDDIVKQHENDDYVVVPTGRKLSIETASEYQLKGPRSPKEYNEILLPIKENLFLRIDVLDNQHVSVADQILSTFKLTQ